MYPRLDSGIFRRITRVYADRESNTATKASNTVTKASKKMLTGLTC